MSSFSASHHLLLVAAVSLLSAVTLSAQTTPNAPSPPAPTAREEQDRIRIVTEEVRLPVMAFDEKGNKDITLALDDVLVLEDGVPQQVKSVRRIPSHVLLLLDTGGEAIGTGGLSKSVSLTRDVAARIVAALPADDSIAIMQVNKRAELIQDWTTDKAAAQRVLKTKLIGDKRAHFSEGVMAAAAALRSRPEGSRHIVIVTDGADTPDAKADRTAAIKQLMAARATVHIISYTEYVRQKKDKAEKNPVVREDVGLERRRQAEIAHAGIDPTMPPGMSRGGAIGGSGAGGGIIFDPAMRRRRRAYEEDAKRNQQTLVALGEETGARVFLPKSSAEMIASGDDVAREIAAQYVVTYAPKRPLAEAEAGEYRRIAVAPRRIGLQLRARRGYLVP